MEAQTWCSYLYEDRQVEPVQPEEKKVVWRPHSKLPISLTREAKEGRNFPLTSSSGAADWTKSKGFKLKGEI